MSARPRIGLPLVAMLAVAFAVRLPGVTDPPIEFHPVRQYHSALIARAWYGHLPGVHSVPRAAADAVSPGVIEPPIIETLAVAGYAITGGVHLWVGRILSTLFWLAGAIALFLIARRLAGLAGAYTAAAVYLFLPFAIEVSRAFQPDPLFVAATLWAIELVLRWDDDPTRRRLVLAGVVASFAILVKVMAVFFVVAVFAALAVRRQGIRATLAARDTYRFLALAAAPTIVYLAVGFGTGFLRGEQSERIVPKLWTDASYWRGWETLVRQVVPAPFLLLAILGVVVSRGRARWILVALFVAFFAYGLTFTWHIHTHSYYSLPIVPPVALSVGVLAQAAADLIARTSVRAALAPAAVVGFAALVVYGVHVQRSELTMPRADAVAVVDQARLIGRVAGYPHRAVYLARYYGAALRYDGYVRGDAWPTLSVLDEEQILHGHVTPVAQRLHDLMNASGADLFVLADPVAAKQQPELARYLAAHYAVATRGDGFVVYTVR